MTGKFQISIVLLSIVLLLSSGCKNNKKTEDKAIGIHFDSPADCISYVLKTDDSLGTVRNHNSETISVSETISIYTKALENLDFSSCPEAFEKAFQSHINAWKDMKQVTNSHGELRGEMHAVFDIIEKGKDSIQFKKHLAEIWDTWGEIEAEKEKYIK